MDFGLLEMTHTVHALLLLPPCKTEEQLPQFHKLPPWDSHDFDDRIHIAPTLPNISQSTPDLKRKAEQALSSLGPVDCAFWTDGSLNPRSSHSAAACFGHPTDESPLKRRRTNDMSSVAMSIPTGLAAASHTPEAKAFALPAHNVTQNPDQFRRKRVFIGSDSQSSLTAFNPLKRPKFAHVDPSEPLNKMLSAARATDSQVILQWIPAHAGIPGNAESDIIANHRCKTTPRFIQLEQPIEPATLKTILRKQEHKRFQEQVRMDTEHTGIRFRTCGFQQSNLSERASLPRPLQTLFSRWRTGQVDSCGTCPRRITRPHIENPTCRFCHFPVETTFHLLASTCPGTSLYCAAHGISLQTLADDTQANMLAVACFDSCLAHALPFDHCPKNQATIDKALSSALDSRKQKLEQTSLQVARDSAHKRQKPSRKNLVIPISSVPISSTWNTVPSDQTVVSSKCNVDSSHVAHN